MTREEADRAQYAAALVAYKAGRWDVAWKLAAGAGDAPAAAKLADMALRRWVGLGPAEPLPVVVIEDD